MVLKDSVDRDGAPTPPTPRWRRILFPVSVASQLQAASLSLLLVIAGSAVGGLLPVWNLNLLAPLVIGYFFGRKIHPHLAGGPLAIALSIMGISWIIATVTGVGGDAELALAITQSGFNIFLAMLAGALVKTAVARLR